MPIGVYIRSEHIKSNRPQRWIKQCPKCKVIRGKEHSCIEPVTFIERLMKKFRPEGECYQWIGPVCADGYPRIYWHPFKTSIKANRAVWIHFNGAIPSGKFVCHSCDNRRCVRIEHLWLGTPNDNVQDMIAKGRGYKRDPLKTPTVKLNWTIVRQIRAEHKECGVSHSQLAKRFKVSKSCISHVLSGKHWKENANDLRVS